MRRESKIKSPIAIWLLALAIIVISLKFLLDLGKRVSSSTITRKPKL